MSTPSAWRVPGGVMRLGRPRAAPEESGFRIEQQNKILHVRAPWPLFPGPPPCRLYCHGNCIYIDYNLELILSFAVPGLEWAQIEETKSVIRCTKN